MSLPHGWQNELQGLLDRLQDGGFTEQDRSRLNDLLHAGPEPQDFFITYLEIDSGLTWDGRLASDGGQPSLGGDELPPDLSVDAPQRTDGLSSSTAPTGATEHFPDLCVAVFQPFLGGVLLSYLIVAIFLGTGILAASRWNASDPRQAGPRQQAANPAAPSAPSPDGLRGEPIALVTGAAACQWADPKTAIQRGLLVPLGWKFAISSGLLEVTYPTGTRVIVQGPATYTANRHNGGFLWAGKLSVRVGPRTIVWRKTPQGTLAKQPFATFAVGTPTATLIDNEDAGVEFGVEVDASGAAYAHVFRGRILCQFVPPGPGEYAVDEPGRTASTYVGENYSVWTKAGAKRDSVCIFKTGKEPASFALEMPKLPVYSLNGASQKRGEGKRSSTPN